MKTVETSRKSPIDTEKGNNLKDTLNFEKEFNNYSNQNPKRNIGNILLILYCGTSGIIEVGEISFKRGLNGTYLLILGVTVGMEIISQNGQIKNE